MKYALIIEEKLRLIQSPFKFNTQIVPICLYCFIYLFYSNSL